MEKQPLRTVIVKNKETGKTLERMDLKLPKMRSITGFLKGEWDLDAYSASFGGSNSLGDIDGSIEIDGHHLVIEFKRHERSMNSGQLVKAIRMAKYCNTSTIFVFGLTNDPKRMILVTPFDLTGKLQDTNEADLQRLFSKWYSWAKLNPVTDRNGLQEDWTIAKSIMEGIPNE